MYQMRWKVSKVMQLDEFSEPLGYSDEKALQYREVSGITPHVPAEPIWTEWQDIPTEYIEE